MIVIHLFPWWDRYMAMKNMPDIWSNWNAIKWRRFLIFQNGYTCIIEMCTWYPINLTDNDVCPSYCLWLAKLISQVMVYIFFYYYASLYTRPSWSTRLFYILPPNDGCRKLKRKRPKKRPVKWGLLLS